MRLSAPVVGPYTPMGATLVPGGATFRTWAPTARSVHVVTDAHVDADWSRCTPSDDTRLAPLGDGTWGGFVPGITDGTPYLFWIQGPEGGSEGLKRDPYARELATCPEFPDCPCLVRPAHNYPWHDARWRPPPFHELIIYQLHVGVFWGADPEVPHYGTFLDVVARIPHLRDLGVTAIQLLPIQEYDGHFGLGYAGLDYFSPEMLYQVEDQAELARHLVAVNALLAEHGQAPLTLAELVTGPNQLKCLIDLCHLNGIAVILDLVFNHAGGGFGDRSLYFYDRQPWGDDNRSLYFTDKGWAGGKVFAYWQAPVRQFLIDNACFFLTEYRADGIRYDEVTVIHEHGGDPFCRDLTSTVRYVKPAAIQIAEYWNWDRAYPVTKSPDGLGFDAALGDRLRDALRGMLAEASGGAEAHVRLDRVAEALLPPPGFPAAWTVVQCLENHDVVRWDYDSHAPRAPRVAAVADPSHPHSWYGRSRARVATALLLTAPGIPMLFMGQEILEARPWHDDIRFWSQFLIGWNEVDHVRAKRDFLRFVQDLVALRRQHPALSSEGVRVPQVHERDRVLVLHRWVEGEGRDVVVVASVNEQALDHYPVTLPWPGRWREVFNSDVYDPFPNVAPVGNFGAIHADPASGFAYPFAARMRLPANGVIVLTR
ncbi:alpha amylase C-terminal domain-containing protein [Elioraea tepidiphila]|uniref:alpha amylase C-terminal domain-containing protein n=1 Tax=Elioraea tepidiphila TaxID=457934 RepID=UPI002FD8E3A9